VTPSRRRDRRGRGPRGGLLPQGAQVGDRLVGLPGWRSRSERFAALVHDEAGALHRRWSEPLGDLRVRVEEVPPEREPTEGVLRDGPDGEGAALARAEPGLLVVYRRPLELRADSPEDLADLVHDVVVEAISELLGMDPDEVDPDQG
jgi:predicted Zn-dependent protease with MMP-like domain